jgi:hypothetical protein
LALQRELSVDPRSDRRQGVEVVDKFLGGSRSSCSCKRATYWRLVQFQSRYLEVVRTVKQVAAIHRPSERSKVRSDYANSPEGIAEGARAWGSICQEPFDGRQGARLGAEIAQVVSNRVDVVFDTALRSVA